MKLLMGLSLCFIKLSLFPSQNLMFWMGIAIALDFLTGFAKAVVLNKARTSNAMRRTVTKFLQYGGALAVGIVLAHTAQEKAAEGLKDLLGYFNDSLVVFIIYIEVTSIFENLVEMDSSSSMSRYLFTPVLRVLTAQFKKLPLVQAGETASGTAALLLIISLLATGCAVDKELQAREVPARLEKINEHRQWTGGGWKTSYFHHFATGDGLRFSLIKNYRDTTPVGSVYVLH